MQNDKRKLSPRLPMINAWGCLFGLVMLAGGLLAGAAVGLFGLPYLLNYDVTQTVAWVRIHLRETEQSDTAMQLNSLSMDLNSTAQAAQNFGTQAAINADATQLALGNANALLNQTATQSSLFGQATATTRAEQYNQSLTQIALDQQGTQVGMQQNATQVQQRLAEEATKVQLNFQATQAAIQGQPFTVTPAGQSSAPQQIIMAQSVPTQAQVAPTEAPVVQVQSTALLETSFGTGADTSAWIPSKTEHWGIETGGIRALETDAVMASRDEFGSPLEIAVIFTPALSQDSDYRILFGRDANEGYEVILNAAALTARQITLAKANGELIVSNGAQGALTANTRLVATITNDQLIVTLNGETVLTSQLPTPPQGHLAVSFPKGAFLKSVTVR